MRTTLLTILSASVITACAACSSPSGGQSTTESLTTTSTLPANNSIAQYTQNEKQSEPLLTISIGDAPMTCEVGPAVGSHYLTINLYGTAASVGTYAIDNRAGTAASAYRLISAGGSAVSSVDDGATGTVTVGQIFAVTDDPTKSSASGTYDVTFPDGHYSGSFEARGCASSLNEIVPAPAP